MALKKSQLYSSLWQSCDELRGGMDASQYKDYVLTLLFMKYVSDKYAGKPDALIPLLARAMYLVKYIEQMGTGTLDMIERCVRGGLREPEFEASGEFVTRI